LGQTYITLWSRQRASRPMVAALQFGQVKWVDPRPVSVSPQEVQRKSETAIVIPFARAAYFLARPPRRRAATRVAHIKSAPRKATAPATYQIV
jgi:hypothetical protein